MKEEAGKMRGCALWSVGSGGGGIIFWVRLKAALGDFSGGSPAVKFVPREPRLKLHTHEGFLGRGSCSVL